MATRKLTPEELQAVTRLAKQWGKIIVRHAFGEQGAVTSRPAISEEFVAILTLSVLHSWVLEIDL